MVKLPLLFVSNFYLLVLEYGFVPELSWLRNLRCRPNDQLLTSVPTFSPVTTLRRLPSLFISKTIMGRLFSIQRVKAVMSITRRLLVRHSWKEIVLNLVALGSF